MFQEVKKSAWENFVKAATDAKNRAVIIGSVSDGYSIQDVSPLKVIVKKIQGDNFEIGKRGFDYFLNHFSEQKKYDIGTYNGVRGKVDVIVALSSFLSWQGKFIVFQSKKALEIKNVGTTEFGGQLLYLGLPEAKKSFDEIFEEYKEVIFENGGVFFNARIIKNPKGDNFILLFDIPDTDADWGGSFRLFLYPDDNKVLGTFKYLREVNLPDEKIEGKYESRDHQVLVTLTGIEGGKLSYGAFLRLMQKH